MYKRQHRHSGENCALSIMERIKNGENAAIVTDAGMPCISDPGEDLVKICAENEVDVKVVPGPSAVISALAVSGLSTSRFSVEGFLSVNKKQRYEHLENIQNDTRTLIFYEAPHKLRNTLKDFLKYFGDRKISLCRELTKVYEEILRMTVSEAIFYYESHNPKGEYVLVVEGAQERKDSGSVTLEQAVRMAEGLINEGVKPSEACKRIAKDTNFSKGSLYSAVVNK